MSVEQAVGFAAWLLRQGESRQKAINVAAKRYRIPHAEIQSGLSQRSGRSQRGRAKPKLQHRPLTPEEKQGFLNVLNCYLSAVDDLGSQTAKFIRTAHKAVSEKGMLSRSQISTLDKMQHADRDRYLYDHGDGNRVAGEALERLSQRLRGEE